MLVWIALLFIAVQAKAFDYDLSATGGVAEMHQQGNDITMNRLLATGGTFSVSQPFLYRYFALGLQTNYTWFFQQSTPDLSKGGDRTGHRFMPVAPFADIRFGYLRFRLNYQFWGTYVLDSLTPTNRPLSYTEPRGWRGEAQVCWIHRYGEKYNAPTQCLAWVGAYYEEIRFASQVEGYNANSLANRLILDDGGVSVGVTF